MARNKIKTIREFNDNDLKEKLEDIKADLAEIAFRRCQGYIEERDWSYPMET